MESIMLEGERNSYRIPHINKTKPRREGRLIEHHICSEEAMDNTSTVLNEILATHTL